MTQKELKKQIIAQGLNPNQTIVIVVRNGEQIGSYKAKNDDAAEWLNQFIRFWGDEIQIEYMHDPNLRKLEDMFVDEATEAYI